MMNLVKDNPLFKEMAAYVEWCETRRKALEAEKEEMLKAKVDWEDEKFVAVREKLNALKADPYGAGAWKAWRAVYWNENEKNPDELCVRDFCWEKELPDFVETLRRFGLREFVTIDSSTALMRTIHGLQDCGCEFTGTAIVDKKKFFTDEKDPYDHQQGLRFSLYRECDGD